MFDGGTLPAGAARRGELRALRQMEGHSLPHPEQPDWVRLNVQEWVAPHLKEAYGEAWGREIAALETPPPVDLRVNRLKATVEEARAALQREGIDTEPMRYAPERAAPQAPPVGGGGRGLPERPYRNPGRGLAARRRPGRCPARHAGRRLLRRRRRQDARHGGRHEQQGPGRRHGRAREAPRPLRPAPAPRRRAQCRAPRASTPTIANG